VAPSGGSSGVSSPLLILRVLDRCVRIVCQDRDVAALIHAGYGGLLGDGDDFDLEYTASRLPGTAGFSLNRRGGEPRVAEDDAEFLLLFETEMSIELQKLRCDLYFLHSAAVEFQGRGALLVAESGGGKSTTTWGLMHHGFGYLSDELAPVDPRSMKVHPYPRALCLKRLPPGPYDLPATTIRTRTTLHVPTNQFTSGVATSAIPTAAIFFVRYQATARPAVEPVSKAEATARLLANALNPLAHAGAGLDVAVRIADTVPAFRLRTGPLPLSCALVKAALDGRAAELTRLSD
jgi:hypothetical protein